VITAAMIALIVIAAAFMARSWRQQDRLDAARAEILEADKTRGLAEAELNRQRDLAEQSMRLNAAVENITQGLCMFDKDGRLVACNDIWAKMYNLPPELARPGALYSDIISHRFESKLVKGAPENHLLALSAMFDTQMASRIDEHTNGRLVRITR